MKIGIAGTGKMGTAIAGRLHSLGHQVWVWNRTSAKADGAIKAGATWTASPKELIQHADIVICLLTNEQALDEVYGSPQGLLAGAGQGKLIIEMSTVSPDKQTEMAKRVSSTGAKYLECPVGGSIGPAKEGKLLGFVGGHAEDLDLAKPVLEQLCRRIEHIGGYGAGSMMKLAINLPLMVYWQILAEALSLIEPLGIDPKLAIDIFADSSGGNNLLKNRGPLIAQTLMDGKTDSVNVPVNTLIKDMQAMCLHAQTLNRHLPLTELAMANFQKTANAGLGPADSSEHLVWWLNHR